MVISVTSFVVYFEGRTFDDVLADVEKEQYEELEVSTVLEHTRAFVKVQDGCNQFCSYCIIPYARGRVRSRRMENVIAEIKRLAEAGIQEVVLTGIHLSSYGREIDGEYSNAMLLDFRKSYTRTSQLESNQRLSCNMRFLWNDANNGDLLKLSTPQWSIHVVFALALTTSL